MNGFLTTIHTAIQQKRTSKQAEQQRATVARVFRALALIEFAADKRAYLETHDTTTLLALRAHLINNWKPVYISMHRANEAVLETRGYQPI